jgi:hypothetical protein
MRRFHFSVDDVLGAVLQLSDWGLTVEAQPMLGFLTRLYAETGVESALYCFHDLTLADGRRRSLDQITGAACDVLAAAPAFRWGPHAVNYATAPHAQTVAEATASFAALDAALSRFAPPHRRADWVRLHYFSELYELAPLWAAQGITALMTTDKPARAWRLPEGCKADLAASGRTSHIGMGFVTSHLRLEFFRDDDPAQFCDRIDEAVARHGFCTLFTHEADLDDPVLRRLLAKACKHVARSGWA